jgi:hypothetical protein
LLIAAAASLGLAIAVTLLELKWGLEGVECQMALIGEAEYRRQLAAMDRVPSSVVVNGPYAVAG